MDAFKIVFFFNKIKWFLIFYYFAFLTLKKVQFYKINLYKINLQVPIFSIENQEFESKILDIMVVHNYGKDNATYSIHK